ncbi:MAG: hypothetical protein IJP71_06885 [Lachnospiraceae bacterium]|nr:hypothetical protein [Lachnospiraceae bacterium]
MKKILSLVLVAFLALASFTACQNSAGSGAAKVENVAMNKISIADAKANIGNSDYLFLDTRKAADYQASHIDGAVNADLEKVVTNNDYAAGTEAVKPIVQGLDKNIIVICYTGNKYAQAATNILSSLGYNMSKVKTLDGGMKAWEESNVALGDKTNGNKIKEGVVTTEVDMSSYPKGKVVKVWIPVAHGNSHQEVGEPIFEANGASDARITTDANGNKMLYVEWDANVEPSDRKAKVSFYAKRYNIVRPELVESGSIPNDIKSKYLSASSTVPITGEVKAKAEEIVAGKTTILEKARAIYDWIVANMNRDNSVRGCGTGEVEMLLTRLTGKCTDINSVFVGLTRAVGIPSREMFGIRMNAEDITGNQHCWAEFYLPGTGWVAADPADVLKAVLTNNWDKSQKETLDLQEFYFGSNDESRVELSAGRDVDLNPKQANTALNNFGYPYAEVDNELIDCWAPKDFVYTISFREGVKSISLPKNRVYVNADYVKSLIDGEQPESKNYVIAYVNYGAEADEQYKKGHIPGAIIVGDVDVEDATGSEEGAYNLLPAEEMEKIALSRGIDKDTVVVLYGDDVNGVARVAYGYLWLGVENVKILNGGLKAWTNEGFATETDSEHKKDAKTSFGVKTPAHPEYWMSLDEARNKIATDPNFKLISIRSYDEFVGNTSGYNYMDKAGEPEGAVWAKSAKTAGDVAYICNDDNTVMELSGMKKVWKDAGNDFDVDKDFCAFYCGTGWRACPPFLAMYQEGHKNMAVYDGGWYEYLFHDDLPVQVGDPQKGEVEHTTVGKLPTGKAAK